MPRSHRLRGWSPARLATNGCAHNETTRPQRSDRDSSRGRRTRVRRSPPRVRGRDRGSLGGGTDAGGRGVASATRVVRARAGRDTGTMTAPRLVLDLFAGPGGWSEGAAAVGLVDIGIEHDLAACQTRAAAGHLTIRADVSAYPTAPFAGKV